ncbi:MAG TPA: metallophosphoesterase [Thermopolyspora sp.]
MGNRIVHPPAERSLLFIGDTHIGDNPSNRWTKMADAILADSFTPAGIVHIGDLTDQSDAPSVALAKTWWARFPEPKCLTVGDHDQLNGVTSTDWEDAYGTTVFKTVDFGFAAVITTYYLWTTTIRDAVIAAAAAIAPKPVFLCHHRPLRDTTGAGTAPHDNLSASAPSYTYAMGSTEDGYVRAAVDASPNIVGVFAGHTHAWLDDPGAATLVDMGTRQVPYFNCSSITYVGGTKQFFSDPLVGLVVTLLPDDQTIELRYRDYGAGGLYTFWDSARGRVTTLKATP